MKEVLEKIKQIKVVPVAVIDDENKAESLAAALINGKLPIAEVTFRTKAAADCIRKMSSRFPEMLVGAGTVLNKSQAVEAYESGAKFIVSPGFSPVVADFCKDKNLLYLPGCVTPTEIMAALEAEIKTVKFFPAGTFGGLKAIKSLAAPFGNVKFMPTGGINSENLKEYLSYDSIIACGGSWMVDSALISRGDFGKIENLCKEAAAIAASVKK